MQPKDLIGHVVDSLRFQRILGSGRDNEVFLVVHQPTQQHFALRLSVDNPIWNEPTVPLNISNAADERANVAGSVAYNRMFWERQVKGQKPWWRFWGSRESQHWGMTSPTMYGVYNERYLVPLNEPRRLRSEVDVDQVIATAATIDLPESLGVFSVFCDLLGVASLLARSSMLPPEYWKHDVVRFFASKSVCTTVLNLWTNRKSVNKGDTDYALAALAPELRDPAYPDPAENLILILSAIANARRISPQTLFSTLKSTHFRRNVAPSDVTQIERMLAFYSTAGVQLLGLDAVALAIGNLKTLLETLREAPLDPSHFTSANPGPFELRETGIPPRLSYAVILQEFIGGYNTFQ
jgi:hypothetical protein